jgi:DNA-binding IclR family transcriptional regulator
MNTKGNSASQIHSNRFVVSLTHFEECNMKTRVRNSRTLIETLSSHSRRRVKTRRGGKIPSDASGNGS